MAAEKLVDAEFVARLVSGSYESAIGAVDQAVIENAELFGLEEGDSGLSTLATYPGHLIVATESGDFFRAKWAANEDGSIVITAVESIDVPVYEPAAAGVQVREESSRIVRLIMDGKVEEASDGMGNLYRLVKRGARLTAEGVEELFNTQDFATDDWCGATTENEKMMRQFLGTEVSRLSDIAKPQFEAVISGTDVDADRYRKAVKSAVAGLRARFEAMRKSLALARQVDENYRPRTGGADPTSVTDFVDFVGSLGEAMDAAIAILADAEVVCEDGNVRCVARVHDGIASQAYEWVLATAFAEKLARRFEPVAA